MKVSFCDYDSPIKKMWSEGKLPRVKYGLYGEVLTSDTLSVEHLVPVRKGGSLAMENTALANKFLNSLRGVEDLKEVLTRKQAFAYIEQFWGNRTQIINKYIEGIYKTFRKLTIL